MNIQQIVEKLIQNEVVAYPTEAVFGLGCNPKCGSAVQKLLILKQRPMEKGLILVAPSLDYLLPFIDTTHFRQAHWDRLQTRNDRPTTWVIPAKHSTPNWLTGQFDSIAVRLCDHIAVKQLCEQTGFALTSTSANLSTFPPCRTAEEVKRQFGTDFPVLDLPVGNAQNPSEIRHLFTHQLLREG